MGGQGARPVAEGSRALPRKCHLREPRVVATLSPVWGLGIHVHRAVGRGTGEGYCVTTVGHEAAGGVGRDLVGLTESFHWPSVEGVCKSIECSLDGWSKILSLCIFFAK